MKLYDKSKDTAEKRLNKLQLEKEEKNFLKDKLSQSFKMHESQQNEIACLLNMQQAQQQVIEEYKSMIDGFKWPQGWYLLGKMPSLTNPIL